MVGARVIILWWFAWGAATAAAQSDEEAQHRYEAGRRAYAEGRFEQALEDWQVAHRLSGRPQLLNNIAEAYDRLHRDREALEHFERFLAACTARCEVPRETRVRIENRIAALRAEQRRDEGPGADGSPSPPPFDAGSGPWIAGGAGIAVAAVGAILAGVAISDIDAIESAPQGSRWADYAERYTRTEAMSIAGFVMIGVGAAGLAAGLLWLIAGPSIGGSAHVDVQVAPDAVALSVRGVL